MWTLRILAVVVVAGIASEPLLLKSRMFREYVVHKVVQQLGNATGARIEIGNVELQSEPFTAHFFDVTLHGKENPNEPPILRVEKITVRPKILRLLRGELALEELLIDHPEVHAVVGHGFRSNVPQPSPGTSGVGGSPLNLSIGHLLISKGEISYEDARVPLDADLYNLGIEMRFDPHANRHRCSITYHNARLHYLNYASIRHSLAANFSTTPSHLSIESIRLAVGSSAAFVRGELDDFSNPKVVGDYDVRIHTQDFKAESASLTLAGDIRLSGKFHYRNALGRSFLQNLSFDGHLASDSISASVRDALWELRRLHAQYEFANGTLQAHKAGVALLGGEANVDVNIEHLDTAPHYQLAASVRGISLQEIQQAIHTSKFKRVALLGTLDGTADAAWTSSFKNLTSQCDLFLRDAANGTTHFSDNAVPVEGAIHLSYNGPQSEISFRDTTLRTSLMTLEVRGNASEHSNLQVHAAAKDLHQLASLISTLHPGKAALPRISGSLLLSATMQGTMQSPRFMGQGIASNLHVHESHWSSAKVVFQMSSSELILQSASLVSATQGRASLSGSVGWQNWSYDPANPIRLNLLFERIRMVDILDLADLHYPASGDLYGDINLHGSQLDPIGSGSIKILNARIYDEPLQNVVLEFRAKSGSVNSTMTMGMPAGAATMSLTYAPQTRIYSLRLEAPSVALQDLHAVRARNLPLSGVAQVSAMGQGTLDNIGLTAVVDLPHAQFLENTMSQLKAEVRVANERADLELTSQLANAPVEVHGYVNLAGDYYSEGSVETGSLQLSHLLGTYFPVSREGLQASTVLRASLKGPLRKPAQIEAHVTIPTLSASYESLQISNAEPIHIDCARSVVSVQPVEFRGSDTSIRVQGSIPLDGVSPLSGSAQGYVNANLLRIIQSDVKSSGVLNFDIRTTGSIKGPSVQGQIQLREVALSTDSAPLGVEKLTGSLDIDNNRVRISNVAGQVGGGELSMTGSVQYRPNLKFDLTLQAKEVRLRYAGGLRLLLDSDLALTGKSNASTLSGRVLIDDLSFTSDFDLKTLSEHFESRAMPPQSGFGDSVKLAIAVQSKSGLGATSSQASVEGNVNLRVIGTAANPVVIGRTDLTSGEVFFRSRRYQIERGFVVFDDPNVTRPALDLSATTTVQQYNLALSLRGHLDKLNMSYSSDPPLPTADIINLIAVGTTTQGAGAAGHATDSIIASQAAGQVSTRMQSLTGISGLRIDPMVGGSNRDPSARIGIQQRVTKNFLFTFSTDVSKAGAETVEGKYQFNKRWSVGVSRDQVGGIAAEGMYHTKF